MWKKHLSELRVDHLAFLAFEYVLHFKEDSYFLGCQSRSANDETIENFIDGQIAFSLVVKNTKSHIG